MCVFLGLETICACSQSRVRVCSEQQHFDEASGGSEVAVLSCSSAVKTVSRHIMSCRFYL